MVKKLSGTSRFRLSSRHGIIESPHCRAVVVFRKELRRDFLVERPANATPRARVLSARLAIALKLETTGKLVGNSVEMTHPYLHTLKVSDISYVNIMRPIQYTKSSRHQAKLSALLGRTFSPFDMNALLLFLERGI